MLMKRKVKKSIKNLFGNKTKESSKSLNQKAKSEAGDNDSQEISSYRFSSSSASDKEKN